MNTSSDDARNVGKLPSCVRARGVCDVSRVRGRSISRRLFLGAFLYYVCREVLKDSPNFADRKYKHYKQREEEGLGLVWLEKLKFIGDVIKGSLLSLNLRHIRVRVDGARRCRVIRAPRRAAF